MELYRVTTAEDLEAHPIHAFLAALDASDFDGAARLLEADKDGDWGVSPAGLPPMTPALVHAAWRGDSRLVEELVSRALRRQLSLTDFHDVCFGGNPLHWAAAAGHEALLASLLARAGPQSVHQRSWQGYTVLHAAACYGNTACVRLLLQHQADPNAVDDEAGTPLHEAAQWGQAAAARELLACKADAAARNRAAETPLLLAARGGFTDVMQELLRVGAAVDCRNAAGITPLLSAAFFGHERAVRLLQASGAALSAVDARRRRSALEWAAFNNHCKVVEVLLEQQRDHAAAAKAAATESEAEDVLALLASL